MSDDRTILELSDKETEDYENNPGELGRSDKQFY